MSILDSHSLTSAAAIIQGESPGGNRIEGFSIDGLVARRLAGVAAAPGHGEFDSDVAWESVVRSWWGTGQTWGVGVTMGMGRCEWNLIHSENQSSVCESIKSHLTGAQVEEMRGLQAFISRLQAFPHQLAMGGHPGFGPDARLDAVIESLLAYDISFAVLASAVPRSRINDELERLGTEEQFVRDEYFSRPGLEQENHPEASRYLAFLNAAQDRAKFAIQEGGWHVRVILAGAQVSRVRQAQGLIQGVYADGGGSPEPLRWQDPAAPRKMTFLRTAELAALTRPPIREMPGFAFDANNRNGCSSIMKLSHAIFSTAPPEEPSAPSIAVGRIIDDGANAGPWLHLSTDDLCRHVLVGGMTGSGKTVTCEHLLLELWREHRIPWLVVEPGMKTSYRRLLHSEIGKDIAVWGIGDSASSRLPMNPLSAPAGVGVAEHSSALFSAISSAFELVPPMPEVLAAAIEQTFQKHGWDLSGVVPEGSAPTLADLVDEIDVSILTLGYGREVTGNLRAGLLLRVRRLLNGPLSPELTSNSGLNVEELISRPSILELSALPDADSQALMMAFIALQLRHHWRLKGQSNQLLHVLVLEEAHRLLKDVPKTAESGPRARAVEDMAHLLAELRGFGAGLVIVDQTPSALTASVIANTGTKILHRLDHPNDRELAGLASGLPKDNLDLLGRLSVGEAVVRSDRRPRPYRLRLPNPSLTYGSLPLPGISNSSLAEPISGVPSGGCPICSEEICSASLSGENLLSLRRRLTDWQEASRNSSLAAWQWAERELVNAEEGAMGGKSPLCFLVSLGRAGGLNQTTIDRIVSTYQSNQIQT